MTCARCPEMRQMIPRSLVVDVSDTQADLQRREEEGEKKCYSVERLCGGFAAASVTAAVFYIWVI